MLLLICMTQHLSKVWSSIHEKVKQHWEKSVAYKKSVHIQLHQFAATKALKKYIAIKAPIYIICKH